MEVADQWRREWAGTAEYGKVTEGGVTRRIARAMEVLHASAPGARVRVVRAAYHATGAPGAPAASYMLHSSRRVISSGFNLLESPTNPIKPLEISSTPLESSPEPTTENYKVTEPDDFEISEPSKWRSSKGGTSIRMPSEESSSADNASIIDLDPRSSRNLHRKYSYDSESSDIQFGRRNSTRASPLLDPPVTLSTLKYKSLLNSSNDWNLRRKSYSFEDTSPLSETILQNNDTIAMESSTDSGICKSSELVNEHIDDNTHTMFAQNESKTKNGDESFKDWLSRNRSNSHYRGTKFKTYREHEIVLEDPVENNITVQATGKVSITLPVTINTTDDDKQYKKSHVNEDSERKVKKVEFCKTELHFAAETGKVNIIATDEKPPPSNDFRKRRSAFVPMQDMIDQPITLFGDKNIEFTALNGTSSILNYINGEFGETDENTAATKSILKNKIPKPKPYLLGENMGFGLSDDLSTKDQLKRDSGTPVVSIVNKQLATEKRSEKELKTIFSHDEDSSKFSSNVFRTINKGPSENDSFRPEEHSQNYSIIGKSNPDNTMDNKDVSFIKKRFNALQTSPVQRKAKTRELRKSDLTYFGIDRRNTIDEDESTYFENKVTSSDTSIDDLFHSVKLIQQVSNSLCNSEVESDDGPDYQNVPMNLRYAPIPTPRARSKYNDKANEIYEVKVLRPIIEKENEDVKDVINTNSRRSKLRRQEETITSRSLSAPPKSLRTRSTEKQRRHEDQSSRSSKHDSVKEVTKSDAPKTFTVTRKSASDDDNPIYVNLSLAREKLKKNLSQNTLEKNSQKIAQRKTRKIPTSGSSIEQKKDTLDKSYNKSHSERKITDRPTYSRSSNSPHKNISINSPNASHRTEKPDENRHKSGVDLCKTANAHKSRERNRTDDQSIPSKNLDHRSRSTQRNSDKSTNVENIEEPNPDQCGNESEHHSKDTILSKSRRNLSKDKLSSRRDTVKSSREKGTHSSERHSIVQFGNKDKELNQKSSSHKSNKKSEYVINYDDKNGTVSSVTKVRSGLGTPKRKKSKEVLKETPKSSTVKNKTISLNKIALRK